MTSYANPRPITYSYDSVSFAVTSTKVLQGPAGKTGRISTILASPSTQFVGTVTPAAIEVGLPGALGSIANVPLGAAGAGAAPGVPVVASNALTGLVGNQPTPGQTGNTDGGAEASFLYLPPDTPFDLVFQAGTGGAPAGVADVHVTIDWF